MSLAEDSRQACGLRQSRWVDQRSRVLRTVSLVREDPRLVLLSPSFAAPAAAAVVSVVVVFVVGLLSLLASPVTRLGSVVDGRVAAIASTACLLLLLVVG